MGSSAGAGEANALSSASKLRWGHKCLLGHGLSWWGQQVVKSGRPFVATTWPRAKSRRPGSILLPQGTGPGLSFLVLGSSLPASPPFCPFLSSPGGLSGPGPGPGPRRSAPASRPPGGQGARSALGSGPGPGLVLSPFPCIPAPSDRGDGQPSQELRLRTWPQSQQSWFDSAQHFPGMNLEESFPLSCKEGSGPLLLVRKLRLRGHEICP